MVRAFSGDMNAEVRLLTEWAFIFRDVSISLGLFAVIKLAVNEFEKGSSLLGVACQPCLEGIAHNC
jgi:hypothetical protein